MASSRTEPFPLHGLVPYRGALYSITHQEVFSQGRHYRIGRYVGEHYDERVMIRHWVLLENMEKLARFNVRHVRRCGRQAQSYSQLAEQPVRLRLPSLGRSMVPIEQRRYEGIVHGPGKRRQCLHAVIVCCHHFRVSNALIKAPTVRPTPIATPAFSLPLRLQRSRLSFRYAL